MLIDRPYNLIHWNWNEWALVFWRSFNYNLISLFPNETIVEVTAKFLHPNYIFDFNSFGWTTKLYFLHRCSSLFAHSFKNIQVLLKEIHVVMHYRMELYMYLTKLNFCLLAIFDYLNCLSRAYFSLKLTHKLFLNSTLIIS